jgi:hypothetical protein
VNDPKDLDPSWPLFMSHVKNKDGSRRAIARETAWRIVKAIARENELSGKVGTHNTRKTLIPPRLYLDKRYSGSATHPWPSQSGAHRGLFEITHRPRSLDRFPDGRGVGREAE